MMPNYTPNKFANVCRGAFLLFCVSWTVTQAIAQVGTNRHHWHGE